MEQWGSIYYFVATVHMVAMVLVTVLMWRMRGEFASRRELDDVKGRIERHHERMVAVETIIRHMPTERGFTKLATAMERLGGELAVAVERISGVKEGLERVEATIQRHEDILSSAARAG